MEGFGFAIASGADFVFEMDADFSHLPETIPVLLDAAQDADLVLGSRYVDGGSVVNWGFFRRLISRVGNWYASVILALPIRDCTSGFKCFRRSALERLQRETVSSVGYSFQIELTYKAWKAGLRIREVPITFVERRLGRSKFNVGIVWESMVQVWKLRMRGNGFKHRE